MIWKQFQPGFFPIRTNLYHAVKPACFAKCSIKGSSKCPPVANFVEIGELVKYQKARHTDSLVMADLRKHRRGFKH